MYGGLRRSLGLGAQRLLSTPAQQTLASTAARSALLQTPPTFAARQLLRPLSTLGGASWHQLASKLPTPPAPATPAARVMTAVAPQAAAAGEQLGQVAVAEAAVSEGAMIEKVRSDAMVFEIGLSFVVLHYQSIFIGVMRCLFQSFRPLLILFIFGQLLKAVFFLAGAPIWMSFYSIWLFEVGYGLAQCAISFIFISFFYNNLSFNRIRPSLAHMARQQRAKLAGAARALGLA